MTVLPKHTNRVGCALKVAKKFLLVSRFGEITYSI